MRDDKGRQRSHGEAELEREILEGRKFTLEEAIARMAGPGALKGESPIARMRQAEIEIALGYGRILRMPAVLWKSLCIAT